MNPIIQPIDRKLILKELTNDKFIRATRKGNNELYEIDFINAPNTMREIGRLREISFRIAGGGTGKSYDIDSFDMDINDPYKQLLVWDPNEQEILGGYRYIHCGGLEPNKMATTEIFKFSNEFIEEYLPTTIELGRSFVQPMYQSTNLKRKGLYALDNLWDGLGALIYKYPNIKYFFGKVTMYTSYNTRARNLLLHFLDRYFNDEENLVIPIESLDYDINNKYYQDLFNGLEYNSAYKLLSKEIRNLGEHIPPLINSYMNLSPSMRVFGTTINGEFGGVEETGILINIKDVYPEKLERHLTPLSQLTQKLRSKWWKG